MTKIAGYGSQDPDPLVRGMDPQIRIRIHTKMSWIRNTGFWHYYLVELLVAVHIDLPAAGVAPDGPGLRVHHQAVRLVPEKVKLKPEFRIRIHMFLGLPDPDLLFTSSVADPGCLSRILDPGSEFFSIQGPRSWI